MYFGCAHPVNDFNLHLARRELHVECRIDWSCMRMLDPVATRGYMAVHGFGAPRGTKLVPIIEKS